MRNYIDNPTVKRNLKVDAIKQIAGKMNLSETSANLLGLMAENGRLGNIVNVINAFSTIMAGHRGDVRCEVITAKVSTLLYSRSDLIGCMCCSVLRPKLAGSFVRRVSRTTLMYW